MNFLKLPLIALSLAVPLTLGNLNPVPVLSAPLFAQSQTERAYQLMEQGSQYLDNQQWDDALDAFNQVISVDPSNPYGYFGRAAAMMSSVQKPTLPVIKSVEKDLQTAISLMSPTTDRSIYQSARELLKKVQALRTIFE